MARNNGCNHDEFQYVSFPDPSLLTFREAPFYDDIYYRRAFRDQRPDPGYSGFVIPGHEQLFGRREEPWWHNGRYPGFFMERHHPREPFVESTVKLYAPHLCCDVCERRVVRALKELPGVRSVVADQWKKKVVVVGENIRPEHVLRRLRQVRHMDRSIFWKDR